MVPEYMQIMERAGEQYINSGIESITMGDIFHEFRISKKTIYPLSIIMQMPEDRILSAEDYLLPGSFTGLFKFHVRGLATGKGIKTMKETLKVFSKKYLINPENK